MTDDGRRNCLHSTTKTVDEARSEHIPYRPAQASMVRSVREQHVSGHQLGIQERPRRLCLRVGQWITGPSRSTEDPACGVVSQDQPGAGYVIPHHISVAAAPLIERIGIFGL